MIPEIYVKMMPLRSPNDPIDVYLLLALKWMKDAGQEGEKEGGQNKREKRKEDRNLEREDAGEENG